MPSSRPCGRESAPHSAARSPRSTCPAAPRAAGAVRRSWVLLLGSASFCLDARDPDDPFRTVDLAAHEARELGARHGHRLAAPAREALADLRRGADLGAVARDLL